MSYWVSFIQREGKDSRPRLCAAYNSCHSLEEAKRKILEQRKMYDVYSAWIKDGDEKEIVFYECYVDGMGYIEKPCSYMVKYEDYETGRLYEERHEYETEEEANEAIMSEVEEVTNHLIEIAVRYTVEDSGNEVEISRFESPYVLFRWTKMWR